MERAPMSEHERWLETEQASAEVLALLRVARPPAALDPSARARSLRRVAALGLMPAAAAAASVSWLQIALGAALGMLGTLASIGAIQLLLGREPLPPASVRPTSSARPATESHAVEPPIPSPAVATSASATLPPFAPRSLPRSPAAPPAAAQSENQLDQEILLLETARSKLASSPHTALSALRDHELRFPAGQLRIEREFLIVDALARLGRRPEAEARAHALERQAPRSLYGERLDRILGTSK
jgi:hypothetical protein